MLILAGTDIKINDLSALVLCHNLVKLDLSSNKIKQFPPEFTFENLGRLQLLYLHNNLIDDI